MQTLTFDVYSREVAKHIQIITTDENLSVFSKPTRKQLLNGILALETAPISSHDKKVLLAFFKPKNEDMLWQTIANCDLDKLRPLENFIKGQNVSDNLYVIELAALLSDFKERPWHRFRNQNEEKEIGNPQPNSSTQLQVTKRDFRQPFKIETEGAVLQPVKRTGIFNKITKRVGVATLGIIGLSSIIYTAKNIGFPEKQCMEWVGDHYELTDCVQEDKSKLIVPYDEYLFDLRKIEFCDTMAYKKNGKPTVWYSRKNNHYEFFNKDGTHPIHGGELRKVTPTIYRKHVPSCE